MTAHPFQESPTFGEYCTWLGREGGTVETDENAWGPFTRLSYPHGRRTRRAIVAGVEPDERLTPSKVSQLDRRLGVKSPWNPGLDEDKTAEETGDG